MPSDNSQKQIDSLEKRVASLEHYLKDLVANAKEVEKLTKEQEQAIRYFHDLRVMEQENKKQWVNNQYKVKQIEEKIQAAALGSATVKAFSEKAAAEAKALAEKQEARLVKQFQESTKIQNDLNKQAARDSQIDARFKMLEALVDQAMKLAAKG